MAKPENGPIAQEKRRGHNLFNLGADTYGEVTKFKGKVYVSMRRWFQADDGKWYRTKNGLNLPIDDFGNLILKMDDFKSFLLTEEQDPYEDD